MSPLPATTGEADTEALLDNDDDLDDLDALIDRDAGELSEHELRWRDRQLFLEERGYMLRSRFHPEWVPSWRALNEEPGLHDDALSLPLRPNLIDATRISDGKLVYVKRVPTGGHEMDIATYFSRPPLLEDPRNHCVPILDSFQDDLDPNISYIVMPLLRPTDSPPFELVSDIVDYVDQLLEGLLFMHEHQVAHRDCAPKNLLMSAEQLYPKGYHPQYMTFLPDMSGDAPFIPRIASRVPVKYYYVDFGISSKFNQEDNPKLVKGKLGRDRDVPELSSRKVYDPFKVDIFIIGNVLRKQVHAQFANVDFLAPLIEWMTKHDPNERPSAAEALEMWGDIRRRIWVTQRIRRLRSREESEAQTFVLNIRGFFRLLSALSHRYSCFGTR